MNYFFKTILNQQNRCVKDILTIKIFFKQNFLILLMLFFLPLANASAKSDRNDSNNNSKAKYRVTSNSNKAVKNHKYSKPTKTYFDKNKNPKKIQKTQENAKINSNIKYQKISEQTTNNKAQSEDDDEELPEDKNTLENKNIEQELSKKEDFISQKLWKKFSKSDIEILQNINNKLKINDYDDAIRLAKILQSKNNEYKNSLADAVMDIILWNKYSSKTDLKKVAFSDISSFVMDNPFFPNITDLRKNVEKIAVNNNIDYKYSEIYFNTNPALTTESKLYVIESKISKLSSNYKNFDEKIKDLQNKSIQSEIAKVWIAEDFTEVEERQFLEKFKNILTQQDHAKRIERLLWENKKSESFRIMSYVGEDYRTLFETILKFDESPRYIDKIMLDVPRRLCSNELLNFKRMIWYKSKDQIDDVLEILIETPKDYVNPDKWWSFRRLYGREMLKTGNYKKSYQIISNHNLPTTSSDYWEAEWTAGWVALRFLDEPKYALKHFLQMKNNVTQPVTISRALYWEAMCYEAMSEKSKAIETFKIASQYPIFFYGQLAIHKHKSLDPLGSAKDIVLPKSPEITGRDIAKISESRAAQIAYILAVSGDRTNATKIFEWLVNNAPTDGQIAVIMKIIEEIGDRQLDARISRFASKKNVFFIKEKFQIISEVMNDEYAPLVHAIIKQESGFAQMAVSRVGALGYMQLMPATAKLVSKEIGIPYNQKKLTRDIRYNIRLGSFYIKKLIDEFEGSEMLAIASYNAGPNATRRWINEFYDPRKEKDQDKIVDWIELITYSETRNYVQRIIENMIVYKYLMSRNNYDLLK